MKQVCAKGQVAKFVIRRWGVGAWSDHKISLGDDLRSVNPFFKLLFVDIVFESLSKVEKGLFVQFLFCLYNKCLN